MSTLTLQRGWIVAHDHEKEHLISLGIKLGPYDTEKMAFEECEITDEQLVALQEFYGKYYWRFW